jgi:acyl dehydratase
VKAEPHRYWEDIVPGESFISREMEITQQEIVDFAVRYDPQYFHTDPEKAKNSHFGEVVASGVHILAIWRILDHEITGDVRWMCGIAWNDLRWNKPMRANDRVRAKATCISKRESASDPLRGIVIYRYALLNAKNEELFYCTSTNLVERRSTENQPVVQSQS